MRHFIGGSVIVVCGLALSGTAWSQSKSLKDQLVGNWELVSVTEDYGNGKVEKAPFGESVKGSYNFDPTGRAMLMIIGDDLPPNPSRMPQESSRKVVAWFGKYTVDDAGKTLTYTAEKATIPAFDGKPRTQSVALNGDDLTVKSAPITGPTPTLVFKRAH